MFLSHFAGPKEEGLRRVAIAGASGFVGENLIQWLLQNTDHQIIGLSRRERTSDNPRLKWRKVDLFSLLEIEEALKGVDYTYYLVHSMLPSAQLDQGSFADYDLLLADNFARACEKNGVKQVIYLGGLIPEDDNLSKHLESRLEVERVFEGRKFSTSLLRAGLILGEGGSSFNIMYNLVRRLPIMICPKWSDSKLNPSHIDDVTQALGIVLGVKEHYDSHYDLGCEETYTYLEMLVILAEKMEKHRLFLRVGFSFMKLSRLWVRLVSGAPKELVYPLVDSLKSSMVVNPSRRLNLGYRPLTYEESLDKVLSKDYEVRFSSGHYTRKFVRSVQRLPAPHNKDATWIAEEYARWLPHHFFPLIFVYRYRNTVQFCFISRKVLLLQLTYSYNRSEPERCLYYITGGLLAHVHRKGRLEFRLTLDRRYVLAAIHDFFPKLPWFLYRLTQAQIHLWVMRNFGKHLANFNFIPTLESMKET